MNCWVAPSATDVTAGDTVIAVNTAGSTVSAAVPLSRLEGSVAVIVSAPGRRPLARPWDPTALDTDASVAWVEDHVTSLVRFCVLPSE